MPHPVLQRRKRLAHCLREERLDALLVTHPVSVSYLTGFSGDSSYLVLGKQRTVLVSDGRFTQQIAEECPGLETYIRPTNQNIYKAAAEVLTKLGFRGVGFESGHLTVAELELLRGLASAIDWKPGKDRVEKLRVVKDETEVAAVREAIRIAERAFAMFKTMLRPADTEKELHDAMEGYLRRAGARCASFPSIVAVGERAALPHAPPSERRVGEGDILLVDWGACENERSYKSDLTRTLITRNYSIFSRPGRRERKDGKLEKVYDTVLRAQQAAIRAVRPGVNGHDVDAAARAVMAEAGLEEYFVHGLGHGLGLQVHEAPSVRKDSTDVLEAGMIVTIEPGLYLPGRFGIRIEDDVLVTPDGCEVLSEVPKTFESALLN
jgi:Xaa-Pro aminopeptidase